MTTKDGLKVAEIIVDALPILGDLIGVGGQKELAAAREIIVALQEGIEGKTSPQVVLSNLESLLEAMRAGRAAIDAAADAKYGAR